MDQHRHYELAQPQHVPPSHLQLHLPHPQQRQPSNPTVPVQQQQDPSFTQSRMEESLKRSVTLVFWYKVRHAPSSFRLVHFIPASR